MHMKNIFLVSMIGFFSSLSTKATASCSRHLCEGDSEIKVSWVCDYAFLNAELTTSEGRFELSPRINRDPEIDGILGAGAIYRVIIAGNLERATVIESHALLGETRREALVCRSI
jgi:hypothetical protein